MSSSRSFLVLVPILYFSAPSAFPLCTNLRAPFATNGSLPFCSYSGNSCCTTADDSALAVLLKSMNIPDSACNSLVKAMFCAKCDPLSADPFTSESKNRTVPILCNSTFPASSSVARESSQDFCGQVWDTCKDVPIMNSPFVSPSQGITALPAASSKFTSFWKSSIDFCNLFGGSPGTLPACFDGKSTCKSAPSIKSIALCLRNDSTRYPLKCDPFSADLVTSESKNRTVPVLCNSTFSASSSVARESTQDFCGQVWDTCKDVPIMNSPFVSPSQGNAALPAASSKFSSFWKSSSDFCNLFGGSPGTLPACFDGKSTVLNNTQTPPSPKGMCLERIGNGSYLNMVAHPDGSNRVFLSNQQGQIWLATVPEVGSGKLLELNDSNPFLDLTDVVYLDQEFGMMGLAIHPDFATNGRFFVSYNCDRTKVPSCVGRCSCNAAIGCDPESIGTDNGASPCRYHSVIAEFTAASSANPSEVKRIFTMGLPFTSHHAGQILFGPKDGYLYFMMGDGGTKGDILNFAQNKKSLLGKIMRLDVNSNPRSNLDLWGNYSISRDNPYADDIELQPEIWALGFRNPWRCSFDLEVPSYFICADVGQDVYEVDLISKGVNYRWRVYEGPVVFNSSLSGNTTISSLKTVLVMGYNHSVINGSSFDSKRSSYFICAGVGQDVYEEVDLISKGGNYGWRVYEGPVVFNSSLPGNTTIASLKTFLPVMGYNHSVINDSSAKSASITDGYVYRSQTDPCMYGRYLYADLYATHMWEGTENPENSGNYASTSIPFSCASDSPIPCDSVQGSPLPSLGLIFSFGEDNNHDDYILASRGVYGVVPSSRCNYSCPIEVVIPHSPPPAPSSSSLLEKLRKIVKVFLLLLFFYLEIRVSMSLR